MSLLSLIHRARHLHRWSGRNELAGLRSAATMRSILHRERTRADRTGLAFSRLTFTPGDCPSARHLLVHVAAHLKQRMRCTDELGWAEDGHSLQAVFPHTSSAGANKICAVIRESLPAGMPAPQCTVYTYPADELPAADADHADHACRSPQDPPAGGPALPMAPLFAEPLPAWKRTLDVVVAAAALVLLLPLFAVVATAIKLSSRGPVFFKQNRSGLGGKRFSMYKFRSMVTDAEVRQKELLALNEQDGPAFKIRNDPRITGIGHFIRKTSIDELPQLWNVLRGDMSLVGPRPLPCHEADACSPWQRRRLDVTPGLTCIWQVYGRSRVTFAEWMRMDLLYVRSRTLLCDLKLLVSTVPAVLFRKGAC